MKDESTSTKNMNSAKPMASQSLMDSQTANSQRDESPNVESPSKDEPGKFIHAKNRLASHPEAHPVVLDKLAEKGPSQVVERVAENSNTSYTTLEKLAAHDSSEVRCAVTENQNTPSQAIEALAQDENPDVRFRLAENPVTPISVLQKLTDDENPYVVARAKDTLNTVVSLSQRADEMFLQEDYVAAEELYNELVKGLTNLLGAQHVEVGRAMHKLAATLAKGSKTEEAALMEERAKTILAAQQTKGS